MSASLSPVVPIILAAGSSSRMGSPKALLDFEGRTAIELVLQACRQGGAERPVIVVAPEATALRGRLAGAAPEAAVAVNPQPERGQTSSLQAGLGLLPAGAGAFLIFPVDYALVRGQDVRALVQAFVGRAGGWAAADHLRRGPCLFIPSFQRRRGHPVLVDVGLAPEFLALPAGTSARQVVDAHQAQIQYVEVDDEGVISDMDTADDYRRCLDRYRQRRLNRSPARR